MRHLVCFVLLLLFSCDVDVAGGERHGKRGSEKLLFTNSAFEKVSSRQDIEAMSQLARCINAASHDALREEGYAVSATAMWMLPGLYAEYVACRRLHFRLQDISHAQRARLAGVVETMRNQFEARLRETILYEMELPIVNYATIRMYRDGDFTRDGRAGVVLDAMVYLAVEQMQPEAIGLTWNQMIQAYQLGLKELYYHHFRYWMYGRSTNDAEYFGAKDVLCARILREYRPIGTGLFELDVLLATSALRYPAHGFLPDQVASLECE